MHVSNTWLTHSYLYAPHTKYSLQSWHVNTCYSSYFKLITQYTTQLKNQLKKLSQQAARPPAHSFTNHTTSTGDWTTTQLKTGSIPHEWVSPDSSL